MVKQNIFLQIKNHEKSTETIADFNLIFKL